MLLSEFPGDTEYEKMCACIRTHIPKYKDTMISINHKHSLSIAWAGESRIVNGVPVDVRNMLICEGDEIILLFDDQAIHLGEMKNLVRVVREFAPKAVKVEA
jgi:hypothetical protein